MELNNHNKSALRSLNSIYKYKNGRIAFVTM